MNAVLERLNNLPKPACIALVVIGFVVFWPIGLALLVYLIWSGKMFCGRHGNHGRWYTPEGQPSRRRYGWGRPSSGNVAFDEYREETLRKLDEEQREFREYLDKLRSAKDRAEFDQFMAERRSRPPAAEPPTSQA